MLPVTLRLSWVRSPSTTRTRTCPICAATQPLGKSKTLPTLGGTHKDAECIPTTCMLTFCSSLARQRYGHCKLASIIAAKAINDRYEQYGITACSLHPGIIKTNLQSHGPGILGALSRVSMNVFPTSSVEDGARTSLYCATSLDASVQGGLYFVPFGKIGHKADRWIQDTKAVQAVWELANSQLTRSGIVFDL